jgi:uncharacterized RDD family membrane protein YckC
LPEVTDSIDIAQSAHADRDNPKDVAARESGTASHRDRVDARRIRRHRPHVVLLAAMGRRVWCDEADGDLPLAALWRRGVAWVIDVLLFAGATFGILACTGMRRPLSLAWRMLWSGPSSFTPAVLHHLVGAGIVLSVAVLIGGFTLWVVYRVVCTGYWGRTVGKCIFGIQVVRAEDPSAPPGLRRAAIRWVLPPLAGAIPLPGSGLLPYLMAVRDRKRQGGHDRAARTLVIRRSVHSA